MVSYMKIDHYISYIYIYQSYLNLIYSLFVVFLSLSLPNRWVSGDHLGQGMDDIDMEFKQRVLEHLRIRAEEANGTDWRR